MTDSNFSRKFATLALACVMTLPSASAISKELTTGSVTRYASPARLTANATKAGRVDIKAASATLKSGLKALDRKNSKTALAAYHRLRKGTLERKLMAWSLARSAKNLDVATLVGLEQQVVDWPGQKLIRRNIEKALLKSSGGSSLRVAFSASLPQSLDAGIALAIAHVKVGAKSKARKVISPIWRKSKLSKSQETKILKSVGSVLTRDDHRARIDYLFRKKRIRAAQRIAGLAGVTRLVEARAAVERKQKNAGKKLAAVPGFQKSNAGFILVKAKFLRRKDRYTQAASLLLSLNTQKIPRSLANSIWVEQRIVAADLVEAKKHSLAYRLASRNVAHSASKRIDAEFYAGWIALRKLGDATTARRHFSRLLRLASTPLSKSRGHYWLARATAKSGSASAATKSYRSAARYDTTYYGQLAAQKLGAKSINISRARPTAADRRNFPKYEMVQAIAKLESAGHPRRAKVIYRHLARRLKQPGELALLAARAERQRDYQLSLQVGKTAFIRGKAVDALAWPVGAIPTSTRTGSAGLALAYAISRQESTFQVDARSHANALGLMQLLPSTAKLTARRVGLKYSRALLTRDAGYNARLGTAYLGQQMDRFGKSLILTFAAYNAGPLRASEWVKRFGDPRGASVNFAVDWIEQIPYSETRNYVQRVMENLQVYNARLKGKRLSIGQDITRGRRI